MKNAAISKNRDPREAAAEILQQLNPSTSDLILFFATSSLNPQELAKSFRDLFEGDCIGCTSAGEISSGKCENDSIVALNIPRSVVKDYSIALIEGLTDNLESKTRAALKSLGEHFDNRIIEMDYEKYVGLILIDGLSNKEEKLNDIIGNETNIQFVGGSAGDDLKFESTYLFYNGKALSDAALLVLLNPTKGFDIVKTQSFRTTGKKVRVTKVNEVERRVIEFDNRPAAEVYADMLGCKPTELSENLFLNPVGVVLEEHDPFVRSPRVVEDKDVLFYCGIKEGQELDLLTSTHDIVSKTKHDLAHILPGKPSGLIVFNCVLRKLELEKNDQLQDFGKLFNNVPTVGFHTYGESYIGHINQTATMLVLD